MKYRDTARSLSVCLLAVGMSAAVASADAPGAGCNQADLSNPFGLLDLNDVTSFVHFFEIGNLQKADLNDDGLLDLTDVTIFINAFQAGCPSP